MNRAKISPRLLVALLAIACALTAAAVAGSATPTAAVTGAITLDDFGNHLSVSAHATTNGAATGYVVFKNGASGVHNTNAPSVVRIRVTCMTVLSPSTVIVGGETQGASPSLGTIHPFYSFVLEDGGVSGPDKETIFAQFPPFLGGTPCTDAFGPAVLPALAGNIVVTTG